MRLAVLLTLDTRLGKWRVTLRPRVLRGLHVLIGDTFVFPSIPFVILAILSPSLAVVTQIRGHRAGSLPPSPLRYVPVFFIARRTQLFFLPSSTRVEHIQCCLPFALANTRVSRAIISHSVKKTNKDAHHEESNKLIFVYTYIQ